MSGFFSGKLAPIVAAVGVMIGARASAPMVFGPGADDASDAVLWWWAFLMGIAFLNLAFLARSVFHFPWQKADASRKWLILLSAVYATVCSFRAAMPRADVQRFVLFDTWISSVAVGRSVATIAELCFVAQWAILLHEYARAARSKSAKRISLVLFPMIVVAETCSWYATLSTSFLGNAMEESLWMVSAGLLGIGIFLIWGRARESVRPFLACAIVFCCVYVAYMALADVPMYLIRWRADVAAGRPFLDLVQGFHDVSHRWVVTHRWDDWWAEMPWMTLYFSLAVWASLYLPHAPQYERHGS